MKSLRIKLLEQKLRKELAKSTIDTRKVEQLKQELRHAIIEQRHLKKEQ